jgi:glycosyltransferase involved in cell wall biosynthesis
MKLAFNSKSSGLGNGGGTRTVLLASKTLESLGHRCDIIANVDNFTWFDHKPIIRQIPNDLNAIINVAAVDYELTKKSNVPIKAAWWRGHEIWNNKEDYLHYCYTNTEVKNIVNSKGLQWLLASYGADSTVIYPGIDFDWWEDRKLRSKDKIRIGCLYQKKPTKRWKDFVKLAEILGNKNYEYVGFGDTMRKDSFLNKFIRYPTHEELVKLYSSCHIFFLPTVSEGLHSVGLEAALCGCLLVGNNDPKNGMSCDYLFDGKTGMIYPSGDINVAAELIRNPNWAPVSKAQKFIVENIGSRETNMKKLVEVLENA